MACFVQIAAAFLVSISIATSAVVAGDDLAKPTGTNSTGTSASDAQQIRFFENKIRPLLAEHCYECHGADAQESELRVDRLDSMLQGGLAGPALVPGKPSSSLLVTAVGYRDNTLQMPPDYRLSQQQINDLQTWVSQGAHHPASDSISSVRSSSEVDYQQGREHWSFRPVQTPQPPTVNFSQAAGPQSSDSPLSAALVANPIDAFVAQRLESKGLQRSPPAEKRVLLRRVTFDLTGLPPTASEIDDFLQDSSEAAFETVVDRLLASSAYGERWGRHWLDVARYADSNGLDENVAHGNAWRYRDYVIDAFNQDKPYDQFIVEQLAGDLLDSGDDFQLRHQRLIATGFLVLGPKVLAEKDETKMEMDIIDEQIDTVGRSILGLTLGCARCHTHKFDPVSHSDYYGLAGIFKSTQTMDSYATVAKWHENYVETPAESVAFEQHSAALKAKQQQIDQLVAEATEKLSSEFRDLKLDQRESHFDDSTKQTLDHQRSELKALQDSVPERPSAMGVQEGQVTDVPIHLRGSHLTLGELVPRSFPKVLVSAQPPSIANDESGRLQFARWLTDGKHPLTARVMVNRIWHGHFGRGLVSTVDNFGIQGTPPTHPLLLDWLASRFVSDGWSVKAMHRLILMSHTYQQNSQFNAEAHQRDPNNQLYWRFNLQRLDAEAIRDGILAVSGRLDRTSGGKTLELENRSYVFNHTSEDKSTYASTRRSIYVPIIRNHLFDMFRLFDYNDASVLTGNRPTSTIATQALFLMNSPFVVQQSEQLAKRLLERHSNSRERLVDLFQTVYGRLPTPQEAQLAQQFVEDVPTNNASSDASDANPRVNDSVDDHLLRAWQMLCQAHITSSEFLYIR
ncbi:PSD1 and planctomycete cytochrome C domain-containing protein [Stieleria sp. TO1_6]|uniref:PSD1 and planctomycete cytochrome C domain-containing protein n=1 Tax=Stieleria tagensis TaxID=2956795 RepID=UPI00209BA5E9|nr:PSD1 and planctomycete cytochrome C domain-containing protein [Stieleria tagensis]MCO8121133.1 PSD1 and planctomycete cytochrome C domain-containing protein [Stieleria tagensis]